MLIHYGVHWISMVIGRLIDQGPQAIQFEYVVSHFT
jgi:hypothetical protein